MAAFFGAIVSLSGGWWVGLIPAAMLAVPGTLIEVQACWRLHRTLFAFAKEVGGRPETRSSWDGRQAARWEAPPVAIEGKVGHYRLVPKIETITVTAGDRSWTIEPGKGRMGAREALVKLGRRSVAGSWEGEVPGPGPVVASLVGASWSGIFGGGVTLWLLDLFGLFAMPWTLAGAVPVVAIAAYCGSYNRRSREALAGLVEGVRAAGTTCGRRHAHERPCGPGLRPVHAGRGRRPDLGVALGRVRGEVRRRGRRDPVGPGPLRRGARRRPPDRGGGARGRRVVVPLPPGSPEGRWGGDA